MKRQTRQFKRCKRHKRVRAKVFGIARIPRLCVFRSAKHIYAQLIDDAKNRTLTSASDFEIKPPVLKEKLPNKAELAFEVGKLIAKKGKNLPAGRQVEKVVFDRGGCQYHGRIKALADGAREGGLKF